MGFAILAIYKLVLVYLATFLPNYFVRVYYKPSQTCLLLLSVYDGAVPAVLVVDGANGGDPGPQGPTGNTGPTGIQGETGPTTSSCK